jgi:hypothetical protein
VADNARASDNALYASDDIGSGLQVQRVKLTKGPDGTARDVSDLYVTGTINAANANLTSGTATTNSTVATPVPDTHATWVAFVNGTWSAGTKLRFQGSPDNISWYAINGRISGASLVNETASDLYADPTGGIIAVPVTFTGSTAGAKYFRVTCETFNGTDSVTVQLVSTEAVGSIFQNAPLPTGVNRVGQVAVTDGLKATYEATLNSTGVAAAVTTTVPVWELSNPAGSGKVLRVTLLDITLTLATAAGYTLNAVKRSTISTSGTAVTQTAVPLDSTNPAAVGVNKLYTVAPTAGTTVGLIRYLRGWGFATTLTATQPPASSAVWTFGQGPGQALVLRPGEALSLQSPTAFSSAPTITGHVEWTEEA